MDGHEPWIECEVVMSEEVGSLVGVETDQTAADGAEIATARVSIGAADAVVVMLPRGVLAVRLSGILTAQALGRLRREIGRHYASQAKAYVVDYRAVTLLVSDAELDQFVMDEYCEVPGAVIVGAARRRAFVQSAHRTAAHGVVRRVFQEIEPALRWAARFADL